MVLSYNHNSSVANALSYRIFPPRYDHHLPRCGVVRISDQVKGGRRRGGYLQISPRGLEIRGGDVRHIFSGHKHHPDLAAGEFGFVPEVSGTS